MKFHYYASVILTSFALVGCVDNDNGGTGSSGPGGGGGGTTGPLVGCDALNTLDLGPDNLAIVDLDAANLSPIVTNVFDRYAAIVTPSGERVHLVAEAGVSDAKIRRAREVMRMHLTDVPGTAIGSNKTKVANDVSKYCGTLALFLDPSTYDLADPDVAIFDADFGGAYVPLFGNQVIVEGTPAYLQQLPAYDQTFGATAVLVHRLGLRSVHPGWVSQLNLARINAQADSTFVPNGLEPYRSLDEVYVGVLLESHSGVWGHDPSGDGSAQDGVYAFGSRPAMAAGDASTLGLLEQFFTPVHTFDAEIDADFTGTFDMLLLGSNPYSNRAQYLSLARLTGGNASELFGNTASNVLLGNEGNNNIKGRTRDDFIDGGQGIDTSVYSAPSTEYTITNNGDGSLTVQHNVTPGSGVDTIRNIEVLNFTDMNINL